jgi:signal transduction histidine kinase
MDNTDRIQRLERLLELGRTLSLSAEIEPFLQSLIAAASELTASELASVLEIEDTGDQFHFLAVPWFHREALKTIKVPVRGSVAGMAFQDVKPIAVTDTAAVSHHFKGADLAAEFQTRSILAVPIVYKGETLGVLEAVNKMGSAHYTEEDIIILETLASQAAVGIQSAHMLDRVRKSLDEAAQLDRMKTDFIAIASHELRTPLGLILGHSTFLREVVVPEHKSHMDIIIRNAMRLKEIVDDFANIDNFQRGMASIRRRNMSIKRVIEEVADSFYEEAQRKQVSLRVESGPEDLMVEGDAAKIAIALTNLVKNAITFTNASGHIMILGEQIPGYAKVSVLDDGIGIPVKDLSRIFERFYQVESHLTRKHGGLGLGLSVAKVMVEMHGGRIWVESVEGKGSNFTFILPLEPELPAAGKAAG